jgi:subtilisin family serine protease
VRSSPSRPRWPRTRTSSSPSPIGIATVGPCATSATCDLADGQFSGFKWDLHNTGSINAAAIGLGLLATGKADADVDWTEAYDHLGASFAGSAVIGILDTGIRPTHVAFAGKILGGRRFLNDGQPVTNFADDQGHGTHVAGIAAALGSAAVPGVAYSPNIRILAGKVCNAAGQCPNSATADGVVWMADNGAHVINLSLGSFGGNPDGSGSAAQQAAFQYALSKNVLPVCATGNDDGSATNGYTGGIGYPARFPECMAVGATNWSDTKASYSNFGPQIEVSAPGGAGNPAGTAPSLILAAAHTSNTGFNWRAGTSMAAPQVAGLAALLRATGMTDMQAVRERIKQTADDIEAPGWDNRTGAGRINVYRAVTGQDPDARPVASPVNASTGNKGVAMTFDGTASTDPNGKAIKSYAWNFGDASSASNTATTAQASHTYLRAGKYTVSLTVTDAANLTDTKTSTVTIANIVPAITSFLGATLLQGETYAATGGFRDDDPDSWAATVDYGDGAGVKSLALTQTKSFTLLSGRYMTAGLQTVTVTVRDDDDGTGTQSAVVTVLTPQQGIQSTLVDALGTIGANGVLSTTASPSTGSLPAGTITALKAPVVAAQDALNRGNTTAANEQLQAFILQVQGLVRGRQLTTATGTELEARANRILASINR